MRSMPVWMAISASRFAARNWMQSSPDYAEQKSEQTSPDSQPVASSHRLNATFSNLDRSPCLMTLSARSFALRVMLGRVPVDITFHHRQLQHAGLRQTAGRFFPRAWTRSSRLEYVHGLVEQYVQRRLPGVPASTARDQYIQTGGNIGYGRAINAGRGGHREQVRLRHEFGRHPDRQALVRLWRFVEERTDAGVPLRGSRGRTEGTREWCLPRLLFRTTLPFGSRILAARARQEKIAKASQYRSGGRRPGRIFPGPPLRLPFRSPPALFDEEFVASFKRTLPWPMP